MRRDAHPRRRATVARAACAALIASAVFASACAVGPAYRRPAVAAPDRFRGQDGPSDPGSLADRAWWVVFQDEALKSLIDEALRSGYDARLAAARVEEARGAAGIARSEYFPGAQLDGGWTRSRLSRYTAPGSGAVDAASVNLGLSWELDLWGRVRRLNEAALARYLASEEARRGVFLSLVSEVATSYFELRELDLQLEIANRNRTAFQNSFDLFNRRLEGGAASALETSSAEAALASVSANVPDLERSIAAKENEIALLVGRGPSPIPRGATLADQSLPPEIPAGLPSALLERRPDVRESEQTLVASNADVGVATADFFPRISLTGALGGLAPQVSNLFGNGRTWSLGAGFTGPLIQGRNLKNRLRVAEARKEQARVLYERSVTNAFAEVSTALVACQKLAESEKEQARAVDANQRAVRLSNERYLSGLSDYLEVLQAQQQQLTAETALARIRFNRFAAFVQLYKALGGGWRLPAEDWSHDAGATGTTGAASSPGEPGPRQTPAPAPDR